VYLVRRNLIADLLFGIREDLPNDATDTLQDGLCVAGLLRDVDIHWVDVRSRHDALRAEVAARWHMKPEQIECLGCKSAKALFNCTLKQCATKRGLQTCAHCPDFEACKDEQWTRFPTLREAATRMRATLGQVGPA
jgi:hypothetical protein